MAIIHLFIDTDHAQALMIAAEFLEDTLEDTGVNDIEAKDDLQMTLRNARALITTAIDSQTKRID
jgi:hypothetical protein